MSSKWKYADLPAQTRLDMLKNGNKDLFDEEIARTKEVMEARREVGLDTDAQEKWIDNVGYNYNLHLAEKAGEDRDNVSTSGYAKIYYTPRNRSSGGSKIKQNTTRSALSIAREHIDNAAESAKEEIRKKYELLKEQTSEEFSEKSPILREMLINTGASLDGGRAKKFFEDMNQQLLSVYDDYDKAMNEEFENINKLYTQMANKLIEYRDSGIQDLSLVSIADNIVKGFKSTGKIEYPKISTLKIDNTMSQQQQFIPQTNSYKDTPKKSDEQSVQQTNTKTETIYSKTEEDKQAEKAKKEAVIAIFDVMNNMSYDKIKATFEKMGFSTENLNQILERIKENTAQKMKK